MTFYCISIQDIIKQNCPYKVRPDFFLFVDLQDFFLFRFRVGGGGGGGRQMVIFRAFFNISRTNSKKTSKVKQV